MLAASYSEPERKYHSCSLTPHSSIEREHCANNHRYQRIRIKPMRHSRLLVAACWGGCISAYQRECLCGQHERGSRSQFHRCRQRDRRQIQSEDRPRCGAELRSFRSILYSDQRKRAVPDLPLRRPAQTAMGPGREIFQEQGIHRAFEAGMTFGDFAFGQRDDSHAGKAQMLNSVATSA